jgi:hypothetical protein
MKIGCCGACRNQEISHDEGSLPDPDRRVSGTMRRPRTLALLRRWRVSPVNGKLECNWELENAGKVNVLDLGPTSR